MAIPAQPKVVSEKYFNFGNLWEEPLGKGNLGGVQIWNSWELNQLDFGMAMVAVWTSPSETGQSPYMLSAHC